MVSCRERWPAGLTDQARCFVVREQSPRRRCAVVPSSSSTPPDHGAVGSSPCPGWIAGISRLPTTSHDHRVLQGFQQWIYPVTYREWHGVDVQVLETLEPPLQPQLRVSRHHAGKLFERLEVTIRQPQIVDMPQSFLEFSSVCFLLRSSGAMDQVKSTHGVRMERIDGQLSYSRREGGEHLSGQFHSYIGTSRIVPDGRDRLRGVHRNEPFEGAVDGERSTLFRAEDKRIAGGGGHIDISGRTPAPAQCKLVTEDRGTANGPHEKRLGMIRRERIQLGYQCFRGVRLRRITSLRHGDDHRIGQGHTESSLCRRRPIPEYRWAGRPAGRGQATTPPESAGLAVRRKAIHPFEQELAAHGCPQTTVDSPPSQDRVLRRFGHVRLVTPVTLAWLADQHQRQNYVPARSSRYAADPQHAAVPGRGLADLCQPRPSSCLGGRCRAGTWWHDRRHPSQARANPRTRSRPPMGDRIGSVAELPRSGPPPRPRPAASP
jgi:hypothetical protein